MLRCTACSGFAPPKTVSCPHCGKELRASSDRIGRIGVVASTLLGSAFTMTLMACYGCPPGECNFADSDSGRVRSDAQVNKDTGAPDDASPTPTDGGTGNDGGNVGDAAIDGGDQSDGSFDAAPE